MSPHQMLLEANPVTVTRESHPFRKHALQMGPPHQWTGSISALIASGDDCLKCRRILLYVTPQSNALNQDQIVWHIGSIRQKDHIVSGPDIRYVLSVWPPIPTPHWRRAFICLQIGHFLLLLLLYIIIIPLLNVIEENNGGWAAIDKCFNLRQGRRWRFLFVAGVESAGWKLLCWWRVHQRRRRRNSRTLVNVLDLKGRYWQEFQLTCASVVK